MKLEDKIVILVIFRLVGRFLLIHCFLFYVCGCFTCICAPWYVPGSFRVQGRVLEPLERDLEIFVSWELNLGPVQEPEVLLITEPALQPLVGRLPLLPGRSFWFEAFCLFCFCPVHVPTSIEIL